MTLTGASVRITPPDRENLFHPRDLDLLLEPLVAHRDDPVVACIGGTTYAVRHQYDAVAEVDG